MSGIVCWRNVHRYHGGNGDIINRYREIEENSKCPFCPDGLKSRADFFVGETGYWTVILNEYPYPSSRLHLLIVPKRHVVSSTEITAEEWADMPHVTGMVVGIYPFLSNGFGLAVREGEAGGVTLYHLHFHLITPHINEAGDVQTPINFGIG